MVRRGARLDVQDLWAMRRAHSLVFADTLPASVALHISSSAGVALDYPSAIPFEARSRTINA